MIKLCVDENGYKWAVMLPAGIEDCERGPIIGPPEGLDKTTHNKLADAGFYAAPQLMGERTRLLALLGNDRQLLRQVLSVYQLDYYGKGE